MCVCVCACEYMCVCVCVQYVHVCACVCLCVFVFMSVFLSNDFFPSMITQMPVVIGQLTTLSVLLSEQCVCAGNIKRIIVVANSLPCAV